MFEDGPADERPKYLLQIFRASKSSASEQLFSSRAGPGKKMVTTHWFGSNFYKPWSVTSNMDVSCNLVLSTNTWIHKKEPFVSQFSFFIHFVQVDGALHTSAQLGPGFACCEPRFSLRPKCNILKPPRQLQHKFSRIENTRIHGAPQICQDRSKLSFSKMEVFGELWSHGSGVFLWISAFPLGAGNQNVAAAGALVKKQCNQEGIETNPCSTKQIR